MMGVWYELSITISKGAGFFVLFLFFEPLLLLRQTLANISAEYFTVVFLSPVGFELLIDIYMWGVGGG